MRSLAKQFAGTPSVRYFGTTPQPRALSDYGTVYGGSCASDGAIASFAAWHAAVDAAMKGGDAAALLRPVMHTSCVFRPPTYYQPWTGGEECMLLLQAVSEVFGPEFKYGRQWLSDDAREWALEFSAPIGDTGKVLQGMDLVTLDEDCKISEFTVLARPPNAVAALKSAMMQKVPPRLAKLKAMQMLGMRSVAS